MIRACLTDSRGLSRLLGSGYLQPTKAYLSKVSVVVHYFGTERYILGPKDWSKFGPTYCWLVDLSWSLLLGIHFGIDLVSSPTHLLIFKVQRGPCLGLTGQHLKNAGILLSSVGDTRRLSELTFIHPL